MVMCSCFCALLCDAQIKKSTVAAHFSVGDMSSINLKKNNSEKAQRNIFKLGVEYFIKDNWEVGINIRYNKLDYQFIDYSQNTNGIGGGVYTNYFWGKRKLKPYITFQSGWQHQRGRSNSSFGGIKNINRTKFYAEPGVGFNWNINSKFSLITETSYLFRDLNISLGARFFFYKKKKN